MKGNLNDILKGSSGDLDEQQLMDYLQGKLDPEKVHELERMMTDSGFLNDAVEGLSDMKDKQRIATILQELNSKLPVKTKKQRRKPPPLLPDQKTLTLILLLAVLLLATLGYVIFRMYHTG